MSTTLFRISRLQGLQRLQNFRLYHCLDVKVAKGLYHFQDIKVARVAKVAKLQTYHFQDIKVARVAKVAKFQTFRVSRLQGLQRLQNFKLYLGTFAIL